MADIQFSVRGGTRLAYAHRPGGGPTLVFLPGYMSDMAGSKALALDAWAAENDRAMLRLDYAGCGQSEGRFEDGTLEIWRDDVLHLMDTIIEGSIVLIGSSMGGWLMLLVALARPERVHALIGIAAAPDFTQWGFSHDEKRQLLCDGRITAPTDYGDQPYITTRDFWLSGQANRQLQNAIHIQCPVRLLHGQCDPDVPWDIALKLGERLCSDDVQTILIKDGDHRLSRDQDIALLLKIVADLPEPI